MKKRNRTCLKCKHDKKIWRLCLTEEMVFLLFLCCVKSSFFNRLYISTDNTNSKLCITNSCQKIYKNVQMYCKIECMVLKWIDRKNWIFRVQRHLSRIDKSYKIYALFSVETEFAIKKVSFEDFKVTPTKLIREG